MELKNSILKEKLLKLMVKEGSYETGIKGFQISRKDKPTDAHNCFYKPMCVLILQGEKQTTFGSKIISYGENQFILSCTDIPTSSRIVKASSEKPCLALVLEFDTYEMSKLIMESKLPENSVNNDKSLAVADADTYLLDAFLRLTELINEPESQQEILAPIIIKEIYYRLLIGPLGHQLRLIYTKGTQSNQISDAINLLKNNYKDKLNIENLAKNVNMAASSFYRNFKKVTSISPLQYQKRLRLYEAQRLMLSGNEDAASASYLVGYESPTQFSREYKKMFGNPPRTDIKKLAV